MTSGARWYRPAPRGLAYDAVKSELHVACAGGELVTLRSDLSGPPLRVLRLPADLRDVIVSGDQLLVSRFRSAEVLLIDSSGAIANSSAPYGMLNSGTSRQYGPAVAWKMVQLPSGEVMVLHQRGLIGTIPTNTPTSPPGSGYYGSPCQNSIVHAAVSFFDGQSGANVTGANRGGLDSIVLPVDVALSPFDNKMAIVGAGDNSLFITSTETARQQERIIGGCGPDSSRSVPVSGEPVSVAYSAQGKLYVQTRQPAQLRRINTSTGDRDAFVELPDPNRRNWGHALFHRAPSNTSSAIACASCHPEGHEDGRVWEFHNIGQRRTQTVAGGVMSTLPLHWDGDMHSLDELMKEVFVTRMGGDRPPEEQVADMGRWMDTIAAIPASLALDPAAAARGEALFFSHEVGCAQCHNGAKLTNNANADVGTGKALQVPSLNRVTQRAPFMHNGCAPTLLDRFLDPSCGGGDAHGKTSQLSSAQLNDLVSYLNTL